MSKVFCVLFGILPCLAAVIGSSLLAFHNRDGWGWLMLLALLLSPSISFEKFK